MKNLDPPKIQKWEVPHLPIPLFSGIGNTVPPKLLFSNPGFLGSHTATQRAAMPPSEPLETCLQSLNMKLAQGLSETPYFCLQESQDHGPTQYLLSQPCGESS